MKPLLRIGRFIGIYAHDRRTPASNLGIPVRVLIDGAGAPVLLYGRLGAEDGQELKQWLSVVQRGEHIDIGLST